MIGKYEETIVHFNKSLKIEPNDAFELRNQGATLRVLGRYEEWLAKFEKSLEIEMNGKLISGNKEESHSKKKRYYQALADLNKSLEIDSNNVDVLRIRGETYYMMGKDEESL